MKPKQKNHRHRNKAWILRKGEKNLNNIGRRERLEEICGEMKAKTKRGRNLDWLRNGRI